MQLWKDLLSDISSVIHENQWIRRGLLAIVGFIVLAALVGALASANSRGQRQEPAPGTTESASLTSEQRRLVNGYDEKAKATISLLESSEWYDPAGNELRFTDDTFEVGSGSQETFAISAMRASEPRTETFTDNETTTSVTTETTMTLLLADGSSEIATLDESKVDDKVSWTLACDAFGTRQFVAYPASSEMTVDAGGLEDRLQAAMGGSTDRLTAELRAWADDNCAVASRATWDGKASYDYKNDTVELTLVLDDPSQTRVSVIFNGKSDVIHVEKGDGQ